MSTPTQRTNPFLLVGLPALAVCLAAAAIYVALVERPARQAATENQANSLRLNGLTNQPVTNSLDAKFVDADGDLVADVPAEPAAIIDPPTVYFSYVATDAPEAYHAAFEGFVKELSKQIGRPVEYVTFENTTDELRALRDGKLHVAGLNTGNVPVAVTQTGFRPFAMMAKDGVASSHSAVFIVPADSDIKTLADVKGHELVVTDPSSNSGFKAPLIRLRDLGLLPERDYQLRYSNGHARSMEMVRSKDPGEKAQIAVVASDLLDIATASGEMPKDSYRVIETHGKFPSATFGTVYNLKPELAEKIQKAVTSFSWSGSGLEKEFGASGNNSLATLNYKSDFEMVRLIDSSTGNDHAKVLDGEGRPATAPAP